MSTEYKIALTLENTLGNIQLDSRDQIASIEWREGHLELLEHLHPHHTLTLWSTLTRDDIKEHIPAYISKYFKHFTTQIDSNTLFKDISRTDLDWIIDSDPNQYKQAQTLGLEGHYIIIEPITHKHIPGRLLPPIHPNTWVRRIKDRLQKPPYSRPSAERQRRCLQFLLHHSYIELRNLVYEQQNNQAYDLADTFHNVPLLIDSPDFDWQSFRSMLEDYQDKYQDKLHLNYSSYLEEALYNDSTFAV